MIVSLVSDDDKFRLDGVGFYLPLLLCCLLAQDRAAAVPGLGCLCPVAPQVLLARQACSAGIFLIPAVCFSSLAIIISGRWTGGPLRVSDLQALLRP